MNVTIVDCFETWEQRVDLLYNYFINKGDDVCVYMSDWLHFSKKRRIDQKKGFNFIHSTPYKRNISLARLYSHSKLAKDIFKELKKKNIDVLWVLIPPNSFVKAAAKYKLLYPNVKLIFDVIDMWPETMPVRKIKSFPLIRFWRGLRDRYINFADTVVTECNLYQNVLKTSVDMNNMITLYLARVPKDFKSKPCLPENQWNLCYLGSINNIIDIEEIIRIIIELGTKKPVTLHIIGDGEKREELVESARKAGATVINYGKVFDQTEKQKIFDKCHYGLNIMKSSVFVGLTMKSIDYFEAGLPIINSIRGDTWELVEKKELGINIDKLNPNFYDIKQRNNCRIFFENQFSVINFNQTLDRIINR